MLAAARAKPRIHRVRFGAVDVQLRLEEGGQEERVAGQLGDADLAGVVVAGRDDPAGAGTGGGCRLPLDGLRVGLRYDGTDVGRTAALIAAGHGSAVLPEPVVAAHPGLAGVPIGVPRLVHRVEMVMIGDGGDEPADRLAALLAVTPGAGT